MDEKKIKVIIAGSGTTKTFHMFAAETKEDVTDANLNAVVIGGNYKEVVALGSLIYTTNGDKGIFKADGSIKWQ